MSAAPEQQDSYLLELSNNVPSDTDHTDPAVSETEIPFDGRVTSVTLGWLDGASSQAGVKLKDDTGHTYVPYNTSDFSGNAGYIASNDFTGTFDVRFDVSKNDTLTAEFVNADGSNTHLINVFVTVERDQGGR